MNIGAVEIPTKPTLMPTTHRRALSSHGASATTPLLTYVLPFTKRRDTRLTAKQKSRGFELLKNMNPSWLMFS